MDEARVGLIPTYRAVWAKRGKRPKASSRRRYEWRYDYAFVHPRSGRNIHYVCTTVDSDMMSAVLQAFAEEADVGPHRQVVLVLDGAGWHTSKKLVVPDGVHLAFLPAYSPELQPAERLFPLLNEALANKCFRSLAELEDVLGRRIVHLVSHPQEVAAHTLFHWWPEDVKPPPVPESS